MKLYIRANSTAGLANVTRAGRFWPHGSTKEVEVLDQDDDPPKVETKDPASGLMVTVPDPDRIGKKSLEAIKADPRFSILSDPKEIESKGDLERENRKLRERVAELEAQQGEHEEGGKPKAHRR